jgi:glycosyltransferase involved in cell wall biosynthesis
LKYIVLPKFNLQIGQQPKISIITVVYNDSEGLERTISSVKALTYREKEFIVIDGQSTDNTMVIVEENSSIIDVVVSEPDSGIYEAMNKGLDLASGDWIGFMNAGDIFHDSDVLERLFSEVLQADIVFGKSVTYFKEHTKLRFPDFHLDNPQWYYQYMPNHQAVFISKKIGKKHQFDEKFKIVSDTLFLRQIFEKYEYEFRDVIVAKYSIGGKSNTYKSFMDYVTVAREYAMVYDRWMYMRHFVKFILQKLLPVDVYNHLYINYMLK